MLSSTETIGGVKMGFDTVNLHRPTAGQGDADRAAARDGDGSGGGGGGGGGGSGGRCCSGGGLLLNLRRPFRRLRVGVAVVVLVGRVTGNVVVIVKGAGGSNDGGSGGGGGGGVHLGLGGWVCGRGGRGGCGGYGGCGGCGGCGRRGGFSGLAAAHSGQRHVPLLAGPSK